MYVTMSLILIFAYKGVYSDLILYTPMFLSSMFFVYEVSELITERKQWKNDPWQ